MIEIPVVGGGIAGLWAGLFLYVKGTLWPAMLSLIGMVIALWIITRAIGIVYWLFGMRGWNADRQFSSAMNLAALSVLSWGKPKTSAKPKYGDTPYVEDFGGKSYEIRFDK